jgi:hypothetical protein
MVRKSLFMVCGAASASPVSPGDVLSINITPRDEGTRSFVVTLSINNTPISSACMPYSIVSTLQLFPFVTVYPGEQLTYGMYVILHHVYDVIRSCVMLSTLGLSFSHAFSTVCRHVCFPPRADYRIPSFHLGSQPSHHSRGNSHRPGHQHKVSAECAACAWSCDAMCRFCWIGTV